MLVTLTLASQNEACHFQALSDTVKAKLSTQRIQSCEEEFQPQKKKNEQDEIGTGAVALWEDNDFLFGLQHAFN